MVFSIKICVDNEAFDEDAGVEVARILRDTADKVESGHESGTLHDINGNAVGEYGFKRG